MIEVTESNRAVLRHGACSSRSAGAVSCTLTNRQAGVRTSISLRGRFKPKRDDHSSGRTSAPAGQTAVTATIDAGACADATPKHFKAIYTGPSQR